MKHSGFYVLNVYFYLYFFNDLIISCLRSSLEMNGDIKKNVNGL